MRRFDLVTVVDNESKEEITGRIMEYSKRRIVLVINKLHGTIDHAVPDGFQKSATSVQIVLDARKVHFK